MSSSFFALIGQVSQEKLLGRVLLVKNRDRLSIVADILDAAGSGAGKTRIMYTANLSFTLLEKYLGVVVQAGFVRVDGYKYHLTEHGRDFLRQYKNFCERYSMIKKALEALDVEQERLSSLCLSPSLVSHA